MIQKKVLLKLAAFLLLVGTWLVLPYVLFGWIELVFTLVTMILYFSLSASVLCELYGVKLLKTIALQLKLLIGFNRGFQIIREGRTELPKESAPILGPRLLIVGPENCVILECGSRQTRVSGPATFPTERFEFVRGIYDLRQREESITVRNVLTKDILATTVVVSATYGIRVSTRARRGETPLTPTESRAVQQVDSWIPNWSDATRKEISATVRHVVGEEDLTDLLSPGKLEDISRNTLDLTNQKMRPWGVGINRIVIESVQPEQQVQDATMNRWVAETVSETTITLERARAVAWRDALLVMADGYLKAKALGLSEQDIHREVMRRTLEQMSKDPATKLVLTPELNDTISNLRHYIGLNP